MKIYKDFEKKILLDWPLCVSEIMAILPKLKIIIKKTKKIIHTLTKCYQKKNLKPKK